MQLHRCNPHKICGLVDIPGFNSTDLNNFDLPTFISIPSFERVVLKGEKACFFKTVHFRWRRPVRLLRNRNRPRPKRGGISWAKTSMETTGHGDHQDVDERSVIAHLCPWTNKDWSRGLKHLRLQLETSRIFSWVMSSPCDEYYDPSHLCFCAHARWLWGMLDEVFLIVSGCVLPFLSMGNPMNQPVKFTVCVAMASALKPVWSSLWRCWS